jgi:hypothetical protein
MKITDLDENKLDTIPLREVPRSERRSYRSDYPYRRIHNFLRSRVGRPWYSVTSEFVRADWVPVRHRLYSTLANEVEVSTFLLNGEVYYYSDGYRSPWARSGSEGFAVKDETREIFYIHPTTKLLCYQPNKKINYRKRRAEEEAKVFRILGDYHQLLKIDGIWYEVKAVPVPSKIVTIEGLHYRETQGIPVHCAYKVIQGKVFVPVPFDERFRGKTVGPKDRLIKDQSREEHGWNRIDYDTVRITLYRQLGSKTLKKYGVKNDPPPLFGERCKVCGGFNCKSYHNK